MEYIVLINHLNGDIEFEEFNTLEEAEEYISEYDDIFEFAEIFLSFKLKQVFRS